MTFRRDGGLRSNGFRYCPRCGRALETGETCECDSAGAALPKDGQRATCPLFEHRCSYRGRHYIACGGKKWAFGTKALRDQHYKAACCRGRACALCARKEK